MKYIITINQEHLIRLAPEASLVHGAVLDFLYHFCNSASDELERFRITKEGKRYTWLDYAFLIAEMPLLRGRSRPTLVPIMKDLEDWGFIRTIRPENRKYIALLPKIDLLFMPISTDLSKGWI